MGIVVVVIVPGVINSPGCMCVRNRTNLWTRSATHYKATRSTNGGGLINSFDCSIVILIYY
jgi:hypothetical protein